MLSLTPPPPRVSVSVSCMEVHKGKISTFIALNVSFNEPTVPRRGCISAPLINAHSFSLPSHCHTPQKHSPCVCSLHSALHLPWATISIWTEYIPYFIVHTLYDDMYWQTTMSETTSSHWMNSVWLGRSIRCKNSIRRLSFSILSSKKNISKHGQWNGIRNCVWEWLCVCVFGGDDDRKYNHVLCEWRCHRCIICAEHALRQCPQRSTTTSSHTYTITQSTESSL